MIWWSERLAPASSLSPWPSRSPDPYQAPKSAPSFPSTLFCSDLCFPEIAGYLGPLPLPKLRRVCIRCWAAISSSNTSTRPSSSIRQEWGSLIYFRWWDKIEISCLPVLSRSYQLLIYLSIAYLLSNFGIFHICSFALAVQESIILSWSVKILNSVIEYSDHVNKTFLTNNTTVVLFISL